MFTPPRKHTHFSILAQPPQEAVEAASRGARGMSQLSQQSLPPIRLQVVKVASEVRFFGVLVCFSLAGGSAGLPQCAWRCGCGCGVCPLDALLGCSSCCHSFCHHGAFRPSGLSWGPVLPHLTAMPRL